MKRSLNILKNIFAGLGVITTPIATYSSVQKWQEGQAVQLKASSIPNNNIPTHTEANNDPLKNCQALVDMQKRYITFLKSEKENQELIMKASGTEVETLPFDSDDELIALLIARSKYYKDLTAYYKGLSTYKHNMLVLIYTLINTELHEKETPNFLLESAPFDKSPTSNILGGLKSFDHCNEV